MTFLGQGFQKLNSNSAVCFCLCLSCAGINTDTLDVLYHAALTENNLSYRRDSAR